MLVDDAVGDGFACWSPDQPCHDVRKAVRAAAPSRLTAGCQDRPVSTRRQTAATWLAVGCVAVGLWLLAIGIIYTDLIAVAVALVAIVFGIAGVRRR